MFKWSYDFDEEGRIACVAALQHPMLNGGVIDVDTMHVLLITFSYPLTLENSFLEVFVHITVRNEALVYKRTFLFTIFLIRTGALRCFVSFTFACIGFTCMSQS